MKGTRTTTSQKEQEIQRLTTELQQTRGYLNTAQSDLADLTNRLSDLATQTNQANSKARGFEVELTDVKAKLAAAERELEPHRKAQAEAIREASLLKNPPALLLEYSTDERSGAEHLRFHNEAPNTMSQLALWPLVWNTHDEHPIKLTDEHKLNVIPGKQSKECTVSLVEGTDSRSGNVSLYDFIRSQTPPTAKTTVTAYYEYAGQGYCRDFELTTTPYKGIVVKPGEIRLHGFLQSAQKA
jgi:hypothetical protein